MCCLAVQNSSYEWCRRAGRYQVGPKQVPLFLSFLPSMFSVHFLPLLCFRAKEASCTFFRVTNNCHKGAGREGDNRHEKMYREGLARRMSFSSPLEKCKVGR